MGYGDDLYVALEEHFRSLDSTPEGASFFFKSSEDKERYETNLMYSFRKFQATRHHFEAILKHIEDDKVRFEAMKNRDRDLGALGAKLTTSVRWSADYYAFSLSAFLEALKSCLDFSSIMAIRYLNGVSGDSIKTLLRLIEGNRNNPIIDVVRSHQEWISAARDYRHHLVHRMVITCSGGFEVHITPDSHIHVDHPVCVPETTPTYIPDMRLSRFHDDGINYNRRESNLRIGDQVARKITLEPPQGYTSIEEFAENHLDHLEQYSVDMVRALNTLNFTTVV